MDGEGLELVKTNNFSTLSCSELPRRRLLLRRRLRRRLRLVAPNPLLLAA